MSLLVEACANNPVQKVAAVPQSWSFLSGLLNHVVKELNIEEVLKSSVFVVQKAAAPKNGVEFRQGSIGTIRSSVATSCDVTRGLRISTNQRPENYLTPHTDRQTDRQTENRHAGRPCSTSSAFKKPTGEGVYIRIPCV